MKNERGLKKDRSTGDQNCYPEIEEIEEALKQ